MTAKTTRKVEKWKCDSLNSIKFAVFLSILDALSVKFNDKDTWTENKPK